LYYDGNMNKDVIHLLLTAIVVCGVVGLVAQLSKCVNEKNAEDNRFIEALRLDCTKAGGSWILNPQSTYNGNCIIPVKVSQ
jgi:hypothetical protein